MFYYMCVVQSVSVVMGINTYVGWQGWTRVALTSRTVWREGLHSDFWGLQKSRLAWLDRFWWLYKYLVVIRVVI